HLYVTCGGLNLTFENLFILNGIIVTSFAMLMWDMRLRTKGRGARRQHHIPQLCSINILVRKGKNVVATSPQVFIPGTRGGPTVGPFLAVDKYLTACPRAFPVCERRRSSGRTDRHGSIDSAIDADPEYKYIPYGVLDMYINNIPYLLFEYRYYFCTLAVFCQIQKFSFICHLHLQRFSHQHAQFLAVKKLTSLLAYQNARGLRSKLSTLFIPGTRRVNRVYCILYIFLILILLVNRRVDRAMSVCPSVRLVCRLVLRDYKMAKPTLSRCFCCSFHIISFTLCFCFTRPLPLPSLCPCFYLLLTHPVPQLIDVFFFVCGRCLCRESAVCWSREGRRTNGACWCEKMTDQKPIAQFVGTRVQDRVQLVHFLRNPANEDLCFVSDPTVALLTRALPLTIPEYCYHPTFEVSIDIGPTVSDRAVIELSFKTNQARHEHVTA
ncbi:Hypothetical predicted protein, partial [Drosophila guanche]